MHLVLFSHAAAQTMKGRFVNESIGNGLPRSQPGDPHIMDGPRTCIDARCASAILVFLDCRRRVLGTEIRPDNNPLDAQDLS